MVVADDDVLLREGLSSLPLFTSERARATWPAMSSTFVAARDVAVLERVEEAGYFVSRMRAFAGGEAA